MVSSLGQSTYSAEQLPGALVESSPKKSKAVAF